MSWLLPLLVCLSCQLDTSSGVPRYDFQDVRATPLKAGNRATFNDKSTDLSTKEKRIREAALGSLGAPYKWGGNSLKTGIDESHFVKAVFQKAGRKCPDAPIRNQEQFGKIVLWRVGKALRGVFKVEFKDAAPGLDVLRPGDRLIFQSEPLDGRAGSRHTGIYVGRYKNMKHAFAHATASQRTTVTDLEQPYFWSRFRFALRD